MEEAAVFRWPVKLTKIDLFQVKMLPSIIVIVIKVSLFLMGQGF